MKHPALFGSSLGIILLATGCHTDKPQDSVLAMAILSSASGSTVSGTVKFVRHGDEVRVEARFSGLSPGLHGFHIHEKGDCSASDAASAGGHFNPTSTMHAGPTSRTRHLGDLGNLNADAAGNAYYNQSFPDLMYEDSRSIIGKSVIVHAKADDYTTQPSGDSGGRIACGVIVK